MNEKVNGMTLAVEDSPSGNKATTNHRSGDSKLKKLAIEFAIEETRVIAVSPGDLNAPASVPKRCDARGQSRPVGRLSGLRRLLKQHLTLLRPRSCPNSSKTRHPEKRPTRIK